ncbi:MAG TPA: aminotransferase class I/II-fold pyridoxal phosphate-dependent enzyme [Candidatus Bathyarchaeia archaeon]|nr:aminotransferase class I/II-fold pyridoxal phosphate-dependent enzyme [Candidatus Bathyarchaeia archaeon]
MSRAKNDKGGRHLATEAIHGGETRPRPGNAITTPIFQTATYVFQDTRELVDYMSHRVEREEYGRYGNPTQRIAEAKCAALEGAEAGLAFSSGMAAITTALFAVLRQGQHVVLTDDCYRRTRQFCRTVLAKFGVEVTIVETGNDAALESAIRAETRVLISESPTNPYNKVVDLDRIAAIGKRHRLLTIIDSTLATPINQRPLEHGIDLVLHSATKYLAGHNDVLGGVILGAAGLIDAIRECQGVLGAIMDPHAAYLLIRGLKTLPLRVERQNSTALEIARWLARHPKVERVHYAGLADHPGHEIAKRQMSGFGGVISFEVKGDLDATSRVVDAVVIPQIAPSMGGVESLIEQPALMSFFELSTEERLAIGIKDNLVRLSVGLEDAGDLIRDLEQALERA